MAVDINRVRYSRVQYGGSIFYRNASGLSGVLCKLPLDELGHVLVEAGADNTWVFDRIRVARDGLKRFGHIYDVDHYRLMRFDPADVGAWSMNDCGRSLWAILQTWDRDEVQVGLLSCDELYRVCWNLTHGRDWDYGLAVDQDGRPKSINDMESEFDVSQMWAIQEGLASGFDVSVYADPKFDGLQMWEIREGLENGVDVSVYADTMFDFQQMEQIRLGLESKVDVSAYADQTFDHRQMEQIRLGLEHDVDVSVYADPRFDSAQMRLLRAGLERDVDVSDYIDVEKFDYEQMVSIAIGIEHGVDVSVYADPKFTWEQMVEIGLGLESDVDVSVYNDPKLTWEQMCEVREGLERGADAFVSVDKKPTVTVDDDFDDVVEDDRSFE